MRPALLDPLFAPLSTLPGIGPKLGELFARLLGQESIEDCRVIDLVFHFPHSIVDRRNQPGIANAQQGVIVTITGRVDRHQPPPPGKSPGGIFALYVFSDSMEPRYYRGELIYVHRNRPVHNNRDCVIRMKNGDAHIKQLVRMTEDKIRVRQFNPPAEKDIPLGDVEAVYPVIFRG